MIIIFVVFAIQLGVAAPRLLSSDDLGQLFDKIARYKINDAKLQTIKDSSKVYEPTMNIPRYKENEYCSQCKTMFTSLIENINNGIPDDEIISSIVTMCSFVKPEKVCRGMVELNFPIVKFIIKSKPEAKPSTFCGLLLQSGVDQNSCPFSDSRFEWQVELPPKPKQKIFKVYEDLGNFTVALISDIHLDPYYDPYGTAYCSDPVCCRKGQTARNHLYNSQDDDNNIVNEKVFEKNREPNLDVYGEPNVNKEALKLEIQNSFEPGYWGDYRNCDTPPWAYEEVINRLVSHKNIDAVYYTGDNIDHHVWETTYELNNYTHTFIVEKMKNAFGDAIIVVPAIGNHESQPTNQFAPISVKGKDLNTTWLYDSLAIKWSSFLNDNVTASLRQRGGFSLLIRPGLRVISINTNVAYKFNWWVVYDPLNAKKYLEWLVDELHKAELAGERVHIISHVPPGSEDLIYTWTREYYRIIDRFSSTIAAQFTGHTHTDEWVLFLDKNSKAFSVAWGIGSVTPFGKVNPNYKIVTFDKTYEPLNIINYVYNLTEANLTPKKSPRWFQLYDMLNTYELQNLSPESMNALLQEMVTTKKNLQDKYIEFSYKSSDARPDCDDKCKFETLCRTVTTVLWDRKICDKFKQHLFSS